MLSGRTANGALARWKQTDIFIVKALPTLSFYSRKKLFLGPALGIATVEDRQFRSASIFRLIGISQFTRLFDHHHLR